MALAAVRSAMDTIFGLVKPSSIVAVAPSTREILESLYSSLKSLQIVLLNYDEINMISSKGVMDLEARIRDEVRRVEDLIETDVSSPNQSLSVDLHHLAEEIHRFAETSKKMEAEYVEELHKPSPQQEEEDEVIDIEMIGLTDQFHAIRDELIARRSPQIGVKINGMAGIGKTTLARRIFEDSLIKAKFEHRAFVRVGRKHELEKILLSVLSQINLEKQDYNDDDDGDFHGFFKKSLKGRKCLIVLDDIWDFDFFRHFETKLPEEENGIRVLVISREGNKYLHDDDRNFFKIRFLNEEESWDLLEKKVFGEEGCPYLLLKAGKKIAKNCEGLPLLIIAVAGILSGAPRNRDYWNEVAEKQNPVFENALDQILKVLSPSYHYLPQYLKMNFLYFGAFPQDYKIRRSKIVNLWLAEGFFDPCSAGGEFDELISRNLVVARDRRSGSGRIKSCSLHCGYRHLTRREVEAHKFLHVLSSYADSSIENVSSHRCLAFYNNVLLALREVRDSISSVSTARSLLCTGPFHKYEVPVCLGWRLLRVLDALTIRFYEFPVVAVQLLRLRYLSLTCDGDLPRSISNLLNLEYLIVHRHSWINKPEDESYVPVEIWDLKKLFHLEIMGRNLPYPPFGKVLPKLENLLDVGVVTCEMNVLRSIPSLRKLRIDFELSPDSTGNFNSFYTNLLVLKQLTSLQSVVINPDPLPPPQPPHLLFFTPGLQKLSLVGFGYPWEYMGIIGDLQNLTVLKLRSYAFQGEKWGVKGKEFRSLEYLLVEDTDLVQWTAGDGNFAKMKHVCMKNCYNLERIPRFSSSVIVELVDCNPLEETWSNVEASYSWQ